MEFELTGYQNRFRILYLYFKPEHTTMKKISAVTLIIATITLISIFSSCKTSENDGIIHINLDEALKNPSDFKLSDIVKDVEIISLDTAKA
jgi:hypothetical protein